MDYQVDRHVFGKEAVIGSQPTALPFVLDTFSILAEKTSLSAIAALAQTSRNFLALWSSDIFWKTLARQYNIVLDANSQSIQKDFKQEFILRKICPKDIECHLAFLKNLFQGIQKVEYSTIKGSYAPYVKVYLEKPRTISYKSSTIQKIQIPATVFFLWCNKVMVFDYDRPEASQPIRIWNADLRSHQCTRLFFREEKIEAEVSRHRDKIKHTARQASTSIVLVGMALVGIGPFFPS